MASRKSVSDDIIDIVIKKIQNRELLPGDKLPNEVDMANEYGVSRIALREGLQALAARGLIVTKHGKGSFVSTYRPEMLSDAIYNIALLNSQPALDVLQLRKIIEAEAARLCAGRATSEELEQVRIYQQKWEEYQQSGADEEAVRQRQEYDRLFHLAIADGSHSQIFSQFINTIHTTMNLHQVSYSSEAENVQNTLLYHQEILSALLLHDAKRAGDMMYAHLDLIEKDYEKKQSDA